MQNLARQRDAWDEEITRHHRHPLRAVIDDEDLNNVYIDSSQKRLISKAVQIEPHFTVLDYGCGVGRWTLWFAQQVHHVVGVDISPKMVEVARQAADEAGIRNVEHHVIDDLPLPFRDGMFDLVNVVWVLRYITDGDELTRTVQEICRVIRPGGYVTLIELTTRGEPVFKTHDDESSAPRVYRRWEQYQSLFEECGMTMKENAISSASPLYWFYFAARSAARRRDLPDLLSPMAPLFVSVSLATEGLTTGLMQILPERDFFWCRHRFLCFEKPAIQT